MIHQMIVLTAVAVLAAACSNQNQSERAPASPAAAETPTGRSLVTGRAPSGALVLLEPASGDAPLPDGGALMDQFGKQFVPEVLFVRVGQPVTFRNSEDQLHNVTIIRRRTGTTVFNTSQNPFETHLHTFDRAGEFDVSCDVHPGMRAVIVAATTPYAVYADPSGSFSIPDVTPGSYKLKVSADGSETERLVEVNGPRVALN